jgi:septal ring factor EnvC (AmiA/AmiB activator)
MIDQWVSLIVGFGGLSGLALLVKALSDISHAPKRLAIEATKAEDASKSIDSAIDKASKELALEMVADARAEYKRARDEMEDVRREMVKQRQEADQQIAELRRLIRALYRYIDNPGPDRGPIPERPSWVQ